MNVERNPDGSTFYTNDEHILYEEGSTALQRAEAKAILEALEAAYPGHPWGVRVYGDETGGGFFIRHLDFPSNWGMNCTHKAGTFYSSSAMKRDVILRAGEYLERANLARARWSGESIERLDGVPEKFQPPSQKPALDESHVIVGADGKPLRETPRPQALRMY